MGCTFVENEPTTPYFWDAGCKMGAHGCNADGIHVQCRFCGKGDYEDIPCPASEVCSFANEPSVPYYWDPECSMGKLGCMADGMHSECRFCAKRPTCGRAAWSPRRGTSPRVLANRPGPACS